MSPRPHTPSIRIGRRARNGRKALRALSALRAPSARNAARTRRHLKQPRPASACAAASRGWEPSGGPE